MRTLHCVRVGGHCGWTQVLQVPAVFKDLLHAWPLLRVCVRSEPPHVHAWTKCKNNCSNFVLSHWSTPITEQNTRLWALSCKRMSLKRSQCHYSNTKCSISILTQLDHPGPSAVSWRTSCQNSEFKICVIKWCCKVRSVAVTARSGSRDTKPMTIYIYKYLCVCSICFRKHRRTLAA